MQVMGWKSRKSLSPCRGPVGRLSSLWWEIRLAGAGVLFDRPTQIFRNS